MFEVENSKIGRYKLSKISKQKYLIDIDYKNPISMLVISPMNQQLKGIEITEKEYNSLQKSPAKSISSTMSVLISLPISGFLYRIGKVFFETLDTEFIIYYKVLLVFLVLSLSIFLRCVISWNDKRRLEKIISLPRTQNNIVFYFEKKSKYKTKNVLQDAWLLVILVWILPLGFFFKIDNEGATVLLFFLFISSFSLLFMTRYILQSTLYTDNNFKVLREKIAVKIREVERK